MSDWIKCGWCNEPLAEDGRLLVFTYMTCKACGGKNEIVSTALNPMEPVPHVARMVPTATAEQGSYAVLIPTVKEHEGARRLCDLIHRGKA